MTPPRSVLFLGKTGDPHGAKALALLRQSGASVTAHHGAWGDPLPDAARAWRGEWIVSYLSRWILPAELLGRASGHAINFHPATPDYPGFGGINQALYRGEETFGATCHRMHPAVDSGPVLAVRRFRVYPHDGVASLLERTYDAQLQLFYEVFDRLQRGDPLPASAERWGGRVYTRRDLDDLSRIEPAMPADEVARRVRATSFGGFRPWVEFGGFRFDLADAPGGAALPLRPHEHNPPGGTSGIRG